MDTDNKALIEHSHLENGANLYLYDASRTMIGDRMLVTLFVRVEITAESIDGSDGLPSADEIRSALGDPVTWEYTKQRRFIDSREKDDVFKALQADFDANMRPYISHPGFPAGCVRRRMKELQQPGRRRV
ncbi:MAG: hypothetical protein ACOC7W_03140 [Desulfosalsimonas sp.]